MTFTAECPQDKDAAQEASGTQNRYHFCPATDAVAGRQPVLPPITDCRRIVFTNKYSYAMFTRENT